MALNPQDLVDEGINPFQVNMDKVAERRNCGCFWLYLAAQPVVAPCAEHLARLEDPEEDASGGGG